MPESILLNAREQALAIFIGDDGTYDWCSRTVKISVDNYNIGERKILQEWLRKGFSIRSTIEKDRIYILREEFPKLLRLVRSYLPRSMHYKLGVESK